MDELIENCKVLSLANNTDAVFYMNEQAMKEQDGEGIPRTEGPLNMMPLMQVKPRLLGRCAQCLLSKEDCLHLDRTCVDRVSQCSQMGPLSREEWRKRIRTVRYDKLHDCVAVIDRKVAIAPWLRPYVPVQF